MKVIKNWGIERREYSDELTGRRVWQLTNHEAPSAHFYFTKPSWIKGWPRPFFAADRGGISNLYTFDEDWSIIQLTDLPAVKGEKYWTSFDGKKFFRCQHHGPNLLGAEADPLGGGIYFSSGYEDKHLMRYDFKTGGVECILEQAAGCITSDGKYSLYVIFEDDYERKIRHSKLFQIDLATGKRKLILKDDGDFAHMLACPDDPDLVIWINYLRRKGMKYSPRTGELGTWTEWEPPHTYFHYSFLPNSRLILTAHRGSKSLPASGTGGNEILWSIQDDCGKIEDGIETWDTLNIIHATVSHNYRFIVGDAGHHNWFSQFKPEDVTNEIHIFDRKTRETSVLCRCNSSFISRDENGKHVYSEYLHPRPVFSPDDRYVLFDSDFRTLTSQVYMVEI